MLFILCRKYSCFRTTTVQILAEMEAKKRQNPFQVNITENVIYTYLFGNGLIISWMVFLLKTFNQFSNNVKPYKISDDRIYCISL